MTSVSFADRNCASVTGKTLFHHADSLGVEVPSSCGRMGSCHECIVEIQRGNESLSPPSETESFLRDGYRLACQATVCDRNENIAFGLLRRACSPRRPRHL